MHRLVPTGRRRAPKLHFLSKETTMRASIVAAVTALVLAATLAAQTPEVPYPDGYRDWRHVKSMVIGESHPLFSAFGGIHHIYANAPAAVGYRTGTFPDGAVIAFDLLEATSQDGATTEGPRKVVGVMHKDAKRWPATGGWGFEAFKGDSRTERVVAGGAATACFSCHAPQKSRDYVFSEWR
jgi:hypothetical protein